MGTPDWQQSFVPKDFVIPRELVAEEFRLEPLGPRHNARDYEAWTSSIEHIRATPGFPDGKWPDPALTLEDNLNDLRRHADDFARRRGFTYTVLAADGERIIGCVYIYPSRSDEGAAHVQSWVRADAADLDVPLYTAVSGWLHGAWPFTQTIYAPRGQGSG